jgi:hypothetical protein
MPKPPTNGRNRPSPTVAALTDHLRREYARVETPVLQGMLRVAKTRLRPFFADPRMMEALRNLVKERENAR